MRVSLGGRDSERGHDCTGEAFERRAGRDIRLDGGREGLGGGKRAGGARHTEEQKSRYVILYVRPGVQYHGRRV